MWTPTGNKTKVRPVTAMRAAAATTTTMAPSSLPSSWGSSQFSSSVESAYVVVIFVRPRPAEGVTLFLSEPAPHMYKHARARGTFSYSHTYNGVVVRDRFRFTWRLFRPSQVMMYSRAAAESSPEASSRTTNEAYTSPTAAASHTVTRRLSTEVDMGACN